jgi:hypothetical protein
MRRALPIVAAALLGAGAIAYYLAAGSTPADQPALATLEAGSVESFRTQFNSAASGTRIILLLSPT